MINDFLIWTGVIDTPIQMLYNDFAVYLGIVYSYLPFMILPLYSNLERMDLDLLDAAADLGARRWRAFVDVTLPISVPGIIGGCLLVFIPAVGEFTIPALLGGADTLMIGRVLWDEFFINRDWPVASAVSVVLLLLLIAPIMWFQRLQSREHEASAMKHRSPALASIVAFGYALLYIPIISVVIYSFNDSRLVTLWGGFSLRWYASLLHDDKLLSAAFLSLRIAFVSATFATALGAIVALALHRVARLRGRLLLSGMITAPLVMPEIITGLSLLFLFISMANLIGWPMNRGATTITIAHITFSMAYVVVVVRSRLSLMDDTLEEAAMDLGGRPVAVFFDVTVPMLLPALVSGWLLSFTLSLDDLVISSFVSGPGATTLPMLIFAKVRLGVTPDINAITTIIIGLVAIAVATASIVSNRRRPVAAN